MRRRQCRIRLWEALFRSTTQGYCNGVKITRLSVPRAYVLTNYHREHSVASNELYGDGRGRALYGRYGESPDEDEDPQQQPVRSASSSASGGHSGEHLVMDCEYEIDPDEKGFVLKWFFNSKPIYQWIPPGRAPSGMNFMKNQVNRSYTVSDREMHKHRALALVQPLRNFTGEYACVVSSFETEDIRSATMVVIVPESNFVLKYYNHQIDNLVTVVCSVYGIFPVPTLTLWINEHQLDDVTGNILYTSAELYDSSISIQLVLYESIQPDDVIRCSVAINGTEYGKTKETVFVDINSRPLLDHNSVQDPVLPSTTEAGSTSTASSSSYPSRDSSTSPEPTTPSPALRPAASSTSSPSPPPVEQHPPVLPSGRPTFHQNLFPVKRLRPTSSHVLTVQQANPPGGGDSDEITNVLDFKEIFSFNENQLYSSTSGAGGSVARAHPWQWLRMLTGLGVVAASCWLGTQLGRSRKSSPL
ncbi:hypothetical protein pipiens_012328 [Culex pipiens pipiens]|uniref:Ig-like domain-containing protein n=1 Tax=Culex pipiens pipiens TaxID=38569 RepID=A0ABD1D2S3_CULPP